MKLYAVFLPTHAPQALERAVFVKQGFSFAAFALTPFWALAHKLWLALGLWLGWTIFVGVAAQLANLEPGAIVALYALGALGFGLEADQFRERQLAQEGFAFDRLALGFWQSDAESVFYDARPELAAAAPQRNLGPAARTSAPVETDLLGLFPHRENER